MKTLINSLKAFACVAVLGLSSSAFAADSWVASVELKRPGTGTDYINSIAGCEWSDPIYITYLKSRELYCSGEKVVTAHYYLYPGSTPPCGLEVHDSDYYSNGSACYFPIYKKAPVSTVYPGTSCTWENGSSNYGFDSKKFVCSGYGHVATKYLGTPQSMGSSVYSCRIFAQPGYVVSATSAENPSYPVDCTINTVTQD